MCRKGVFVYTRNADGRKQLLDARKGSLDYNEHFLKAEAGS